MSANTNEGFEIILENMRNIDDEAVTWILSHADPKHWVEVYFEGHRYGHLTSNIVESLNSWLLQARELPILPMLELIRDQLMEWFAERRAADAKIGGLLVPEVSNTIQLLLPHARRYRSIPSMNNIYAIKSSATESDYIVNLQNHTCNCRLWQLQGFPCLHAINVILAKREDPQSYAKRFFSIDAYRLTYSGAIFIPAAGNDLVNPPEFDDSAIIRVVRDNSDDSDDVTEFDQRVKDSDGEGEDVLMPLS